MRQYIVVACLLLPGAALPADSVGKVLPEPEATCPGLKPHNLCFDLPKDEVARAEYFSEPFYAVILKTTERCANTEEDRLQIQALFPRGKVFFESLMCNDDIEEVIRYTNVNEKFSFVAVHAGATMKEARKRLAEVKATGKFPGANIRKMQAVLVYP